MDQIGPIDLALGSHTPIYQQLFDAIAGRIENGALAPGARLPPTRRLAVRLGTHRNTVVRAYRALEDAGFVVSTVGRGTFVESAPPQKPRLPGAPALRRESGPGGVAWAGLFSEVSEVESEQRRHFIKLTRAGGDRIDLARHQPSADLLPAELFQRCLDHVLRSLGPRTLGYAPRAGVPRLRECIAEDLTRLGVSTCAQDVQVTSGSQQALDVLVRMLVDPGEHVLVDATTYAGAIGVFRAAGARLIPVATDEEGPSLSALERLSRSGAKFFYLMPNCHNPTGRVISTRRRQQLVAWSRRSGIALIEDDYTSDLNLDEVEPPPPLRALDGDVIYVGTYSKKLIPALRLGYVVGPAAIHERFEALKHSMDLGSSLLLQYGLAEFLERGYLRAHLKRIVPEYRRRRDALAAGLAATLGNALPVRLSSHGVVSWIELPDALPPDRVFERALERGVLVGPSNLNRSGDLSEQGIRLTCCAEPAARLREGGQRLGTLLLELLESESGEQAARPLEVI
ncbi:MAG: PLP-dependent aminotransferase family protein [Myxococcales bacterium]|nr:PLP-dependent aminotransferase family protein [Myxococcales bacterium]